jgi:hypothetical protein
LVTLTGDLLGVVGGAPSRLFGLSTEQVGRLVRRDDEDALAQLRACRPQELTFAQWLGPIGPARLRPQDGVAAPMPGGDDLARCWRDLTARAARDASAVEDVGRVAALTGPPGGFFGQAEDRTGRWSDLPADGEAAWLAATRGFQDSHQNYHLALTRDGAARLAGLHDQDEARWAPLLRGVAAGARERYRAAPAGDARALQLTFPAPRTLRRALTLLAADQGKWRWLARPGAADAAELALQRCGAALESSDAPR